MIVLYVTMKNKSKTLIWDKNLRCQSLIKILFPYMNFYLALFPSFSGGGRTDLSNDTKEILIVIRYSSRMHTKSYTERQTSRNSLPTLLISKITSVNLSLHHVVLTEVVKSFKKLISALYI